MIDQEIQQALDDKQDEILTGMPVPQDGKVGDICTNVIHKGKFHQAMKAGLDTWLYSAPFSRTPSIHTMDDYLLKSGGTMLDDRRIYFRDTGLSIYSSTDGQLDIEADTQLEIDSPTIDIDADTIDLSTQVVAVTLKSIANALNFDSNTLSIDALNNRIGSGTAAPFANVGGVATLDFTGTGLHVEGSGVTRMVLAGNVPVQVWVDSGGAADDKALALLVDAGRGWFRSYNDSAVTRIDNILSMDLGTGYVGRGTGTPAAGFHNVGTTRLGDQATHYTAFAADGILTMVGTAMVTNALWLGVQGLKEVPVGLAAAYVNHGVSGAWQFTDGQQDGVAGNIRIPNRMYRTTAPTLTIGWSSTATEKKCEWQIEYVWRAADEATTANPDDTLLSSTDAGGTSESSDVAEGLTLTTFTLAAPDASDACLHFRIRRIGDDAVNDTLDADAELHGLCMNYTSNKLGTAT